MSEKPEEPRTFDLLGLAAVRWGARNAADVMRVLAACEIKDPDTLAACSAILGAAEFYRQLFVEIRRGDVKVRYHGPRDENGNPRVRDAFDLDLYRFELRSDTPSEKQ